MTQPKKKELSKTKNTASVEIRRCKNGYILIQKPKSVEFASSSAKMMVFNDIADLYAELKERFEPKKEN